MGRPSRAPPRRLSPPRSRPGFHRNAPPTQVNASATTCLAFIRDGSPGASHTARLAEAAHIPTRRYQQAAVESTGRPATPRDQEPATAATAEGLSVLDDAVPVPPADQAANYLARAQRSLTEIHHSRTAAERQATDAARADQLARWHADDQTAAQQTRQHEADRSAGR